MGKARDIGPSRVSEKMRERHPRLSRLRDGTDNTIMEWANDPNKGGMSERRENMASHFHPPRSRSAE